MVAVTVIVTGSGPFSRVEVENETSVMAGGSEGGGGGGSLPKLSVMVAGLHPSKVTSGEPTQ
jgi:hypothetical protein